MQAGSLNQAFADPTDDADPVAPTPAPAPATIPVPEPSPVSTPIIYPSWWQQPAAESYAPVSVVSNAPVSTLGTIVAPAPASSRETFAAPMMAAAPAPTGFTDDAFINMGDSGFIQGSQLTTGGAQPWYDSSLVRQLYNGTPDAAQQAAFETAVLQRVEQTYALAGVPVKLTDDPNVSAAHTLSVVSNTEYSTNPGAIGITDVGNNGFGFIDKLVYAKSVDELEWAVAHNVAHELMHAFGVDHHDTTGQVLDAAVTPWNVLVDPNTTFGQAAINDLMAQDFQKRWGPASSYGLQQVDPGHVITPAPVPEPATIALWSGGLGLLVLARGYKSRRLSA
jgi:hypothetical protein